MNDQNNVSKKVYDFIISKIKLKEWEADSKIMSENQLCAELNVSRMAVRPAVEKLVALGLLTKKKGIGTFVTNITATTYMNSLMPILLLGTSDIISMLEFRIYFECSNVKMFMQNHDKTDIEQLEYYYKEMEKNISDPQKFYLADFNFHNIIAKGTKNPIVIKINEILTELLKSHQAELYDKVGPETGLEYHKNILKSIKSKDDKIAAIYMKRHMETTKEVYIEKYNV